MKQINPFIKIIQYLVITVLILGLLGFVVYMFIPTPAKTVRTFFIALRNQNYQKAYQLLDGQYLINRGSLEKFSNDYFLAMENGTRTKQIKIVSIKKWTKPNQRSVEVQVSVLYNGKLTETYGTYIVENIPSKGWRIVENVSHLNPKATTLKQGQNTSTQTNP